MKIFYCLAGTWNSGGMERIVIAKANWLAKHGHDVSIVTTEQFNRPDFFQLENGVHRIDLDIGYMPAMNFGLLKKIKAKYALRKLHKKKLAKVVHEEKPDVIISTFSNEVTIIPQIANGAKTLAEFHFSRNHRLIQPPGILENYINKYLTWAYESYASKYDKFVTLTDEDSCDWKNLTNKITIPNFITRNTDKKATLQNKRMIAVGRLSYQKGFDRLIEAWLLVNKKHPDWILDIYGGGELKDSLNKQIHDAGLSSVIHIQNPTNAITQEYLSSSSLLMTSRYEGLPMVLMEAMSVGLPSVCFNFKCGPTDIIHDGINGLLVPNDEINLFAEAVCHIIENEELRIQLGQNAYESMNKYQMEPIMRKWEKTLKSLLDETNISYFKSLSVKKGSILWKLRQKFCR